MMHDREEAGKLLARHLLQAGDIKNTVVIGIPRGGVVVAQVVARKLDLPLDVVIVKKIPSPINPEFAMGAVGEDNIVYWDERLIHKFHITNETKQQLLDETYDSVAKREILISTWFHKKNIKGKRILLIDDGVATGATVLCAIQILKQHGAREIAVATPIIAPTIKAMITENGEEVIALEVVADFQSVGQFYEEFPQVTDQEVIAMLGASQT